MKRKADMTVADLRHHVDQISELFKIDVVFEAMSYQDAQAMVLKDHIVLRALGLSTRVVRAHPIIDEATYAIVMHEIGHHTAPNGFCLVPKPKPGSHPRVIFEYFAAKLVAENAAWDWAQYFIEQQFVWTAAMESVKQFGLSGYTSARRGEWRR